MSERAPDAVSDEKAAGPARDRVRILLTQGQRARVKELTGRDLEVVEIGDPKGRLAGKMPRMTPPEVELLAIRKAKRLNEEEEAEHEWVVELAKAQDEETGRARRMAEMEAEIQADIKKEEKRVAAEFKLLAAGEELPGKKGKGKGKGKGKPKAADEAAEAPPKKAPAKRRKKAVAGKSGAGAKGTAGRRKAGTGEATGGARRRRQPAGGGGRERST